MTKSKKFPCPVCGQEIQAQGQAGHNRSKFHLAALVRQQGTTEPEQKPPEPPEQTEEKVPEIVEQPPKPIESVAPETLKPGIGDPAKKSGTFLDWITEDDPDF